MTPDDITRLADDVAAIGSRSRYSIASELHEIVKRLRALAQQGKAGGVADIQTGTLVSVDVSTGDDDFEHRIFATVIGVERGDKPVILCEEESRNFAPPTHVPGVGNMVSAHSPEAGVTDEMAQRAYRHWNYERGRAALGIEGDMDDGLGMMKRAIAAALAPQPKDAT